ncbi:MAG: Ku protein [Candidatus Obscuribacterales bacterium]|nr:Ku protein [Candidatus Obscuribacterales bacterium]
MGRSMWTGVISFGMVSIPVKLHTATESHGVNFHQLHKKCDTRIKELRYCPHCKRNVEWEEIVKGFEYAKNEYIELTAADFEQLPLPSKHTIDVSNFVELQEIDPIYYDSTYYLEVDKAGLKPYRLLVDALSSKNMAGIATIAFRNKERLCALRPMGKTLMLQTLLYADEIKSMEDAPKSSVSISAQEKKMASSLIGAMTSTFEPKKFKDKYQAALKKLIAAKLKGTTLKQPKVTAPTQAIDLMAALKASMNNISKRTKSGSGKVA